jgi:adenine phosphoribosyltransferase
VSEKEYTLKICGLTRKLPLSYISRKTQLASFSVLGDVELVDVLAETLAKKLKKIRFDYLVALETKVVPLVHGVAKRLGHQRFIVLRKSVKPDMTAPVMLKPMAHFPRHVKPLVINGQDAALIKGKKVVVIDSVISTGVTMRMAKKLMEKIGAEPVKLVAVLRQGEQFDQFEDLIWLAEIPIFKNSKSTS